MFSNKNNVILKKSTFVLGKISNASGVKKVRNTVGDIGEDAREAWETSQNPWVYRISSVWDTIMAEVRVVVF